MNKRGVSSVIAIVLIILAIVLAATLIWIALFPMLDSWLYSEKVTIALLDERISIPYAGPGNNDTILDVIINRGASELLELEIENVTETITRTIFVPTEILLLVDLSGSMGGSKVEQLRNSSKDFVDRIFSLNQESKIALMAYRDIDDFPYLDFTQDVGELHTNISGWTPSGGTYLYKGLNLSYEKFYERIANGVEEKVLVVLGDGGLMDGIGSSYDERAQSAVDFAMNFRDLNVTIHTIGFGSDADGVLLNGIASSGRGNYYNASNITELSEKFRALLEEVNITYEVQYEVSIPGVFIDLVIYSGGDSYTHRIEGAVPGSNEQKRYQIPLKEGWKASEITKIKVYIIAISRGGVENSILLGTHKI